MKIGFYVSRIDREPGHERNVPAHIQVPLHMLGVLAQRGHEAHLVTNPPRPGYVMPYCLPEKAHLHTIVDSRRRKRHGDRKNYPTRPTDSYFLKSIQQLWQIRRITREYRFDVLHFHGYEWAVYTAGLLRRTRLGCPVAVTHYGPPDPPGRLARVICRSIDAATTATRYVAENWRSLGPKPRIIPHGPARDLAAELNGEPPTERNRVLFWRDPSRRNGADICIEVYDRLAPRYPHISFDMAVRPNPNELPGLDELAGRHENVHVYRLPYPPGISLARLMAESCCIFLPFRSLTTNPQLAVAESLAAGVAVVSTNIASNPEIIEHERTGLLIPPEDVDAATAAVEHLLDHPDEAARMGRDAAASVNELWNWDRCIDQLLDLYRELVETRGTSRQ